MNGRAAPSILLAVTFAAYPPAFADQAASLEHPVGHTATLATAHGDTGSQARFNRGQWGLDESEWQRYQALMAGIRGSISPATLSPIEGLGIHARDDAERRKYARLFAETMRQDTERVLAFQHAYDEAWNGLNPSGIIIDPARLPISQSPLARFQPGDRLLLFVKPLDCPVCDDLLRIAHQGERAGAQLDIYMTGNVQDATIRKWAQQHGINPDDVKTRRITLNHERGELLQVGGPAASAPLLAMARNSQISLLHTDAKP